MSTTMFLLNSKLDNIENKQPNRGGNRNRESRYEYQEEGGG
jgi:hypothetical protein